MKYEKPINFRPILFCALSLVLGIVCYKFYPTFKGLTLILPTIFLTAIFLPLIIFCKKESRKSFALTFAFCVLFSIIGVGLITNAIDKSVNSQVDNGRYTVVGEVEHCSYTNGSYYVRLINCRYDGKEGGTLYVKGIGKEVGLYDILEVDCYAVKSNFNEDGKVSKDLLSKRDMITSAVYGVEIVGYKNSLASKFKLITDEKFKDVGGSYGGTLSALIRGDTSEMRENVTLYRSVGIAHIFAVSGIHVGLLFIAVSFILSKIKINRLIGALIACFSLVFYSYLCGFTSSSLRATVMCTCLAITKILGEKKDRVNSLAVAMIIILTINPLDLFSIGFLLSFVVSFSLITIAPPIERRLPFRSDKIKGAVSVLIASQLSALPVSVYVFGSFSIISLLANFLILPIVTIIFYFTVIGVVICMILPINAHIALFIPNFLNVGTSVVVEFISKFPFAISFFSVGLMTIYYFLLLCFSDLVNLSKRTKITCIMGVIAVIILTFIISIIKTVG